MAYEYDYETEQRTYVPDEFEGNLELAKTLGLTARNRDEYEDNRQHTSFARTQYALPDFVYGPGEHRNTLSLNDFLAREFGVAPGEFALYGAPAAGIVTNMTNPDFLAAVAGVQNLRGRGQYGIYLPNAPVNQLKWEGVPGQSRLMQLDIDDNDNFVYEPLPDSVTQQVYDAWASGRDISGGISYPLLQNIESRYYNPVLLGQVVGYDGQSPTGGILPLDQDVTLSASEQARRDEIQKIYPGFTQINPTVFRNVGPDKYGIATAGPNAGIYLRDWALGNAQYDPRFGLLVPDNSIGYAGQKGGIFNESFGQGLMMIASAAMPFVAASLAGVPLSSISTGSAIKGALLGAGIGGLTGGTEGAIKGAIGGLSGPVAGAAASELTPGLLSDLGLTGTIGESAIKGAITPLITNPIGAIQNPENLLLGAATGAAGDVAGDLFAGGEPALEPGLFDDTVALDQNPLPPVVDDGPRVDAGDAPDIGESGLANTADVPFERLFSSTSPMMAEGFLDAPDLETALTNVTPATQIIPEGVTYMPGDVLPGSVQAETLSGIPADAVSGRGIDATEEDVDELTDAAEEVIDEGEGAPQLDANLAKDLAGYGKLAYDIFNLYKEVTGKDLPPMPPLPERGEDQTDEDWGETVTEDVIKYLDEAGIDTAGLSLDALAEQGLTPGTPEYFQAILTEIDRIIAEIFGFDPSALLEGETPEDLQRMFRDKTDKELMALRRALFARGQLGSLTFADRFADPFTGTEYDLGDHDGVEGALAAYHRGVADFGTRLGGSETALDARGMLDEFFQRDPDLFGLRAQGRERRRRARETAGLLGEQERRKRRGLGELSDEELMRLFQEFGLFGEF